MAYMPMESLAPAEWQGFLKRAPFPRDRVQAAASLTDKRILITGAGGSIGSALVLALAECAPQKLILVEASERHLYELEAALDRQPFRVERVSLLGSAGDPALLGEAFRQHRPHIIYHTAAFKQVPLLEQNPFAAVENNALGTYRLHRACAQYGAEQLILLSTDKAVDPVSMLGASKRTAELVLLASQVPGLQTKAVRLGNVLGSEGSIVPLFLQQIHAHAAVTVTHPAIRRFFLTLDDAVTLLLHAASASAKAGILVPDLGQPLSVAALARYLVATLQADEQSIVFTRLRPGDKMCEVLVSDRESYTVPRENALLRAVHSPTPSLDWLLKVLEELQEACNARSLDRLMMAIKQLVPEYQASHLLSAHLQPCQESA